MDELFERFPELLKTILNQKGREQKRTDITKLACALLESGRCREGLNEVIDRACYLYERIESHVLNTEGERQ